MEQQNFLNGAGEIPDKMEGIAATYLSEVLAKNPHGPYALAGYFMGGIIAFENGTTAKVNGKKN